MFPLCFVNLIEDGWSWLGREGMVGVWVGSWVVGSLTVGRIDRVEAG